MLGKFKGYLQVLETLFPDVNLDQRVFKTGLSPTFNANT